MLTSIPLLLQFARKATHEMVPHNNSAHIWGVLSDWWPHICLQKNYVYRRVHGGYELHHELLGVPKYSRVKCEAICMTAKAWLKLGHQQDNDPKHRMSEKEKNRKSQSPDFNICFTFTTHRVKIISSNVFKMWTVGFKWVTDTHRFYSFFKTDQKV